MSRDFPASQSPRSASSKQGKDAEFNTTEWSVVQAAGGDTAARQAALERLCRTYWRPIYAFIRRSGSDHEQAQDMTQTFFAHLLQNDFFARADPAHGRFRGYLCQTCRHFLGNEWQKRTAEKRGGGVTWVPWDQLTPDDINQDWENGDPSRDYDRQWALALLHSALGRLQQEGAAREPRVFAALRPYLTQKPSPEDHSRLAAELGVARGTVPVLLHRLGKRYKELIRAEIAATVSTRAEIEDELRHCLAALSP